MKKTLLIVVLVMALVAFYANASEHKTEAILEGSLFLGDESMSGAFVGMVAPWKHLGVTVSTVSFGIPDWTVAVSGVGPGLRWSGGFIGAGVSFPSCDSGFISILAWNEGFYASGIFFERGFSDFYVRTCIEGEIDDGISIQGRIEATKTSFSSTMSADVGGFLQMSNIWDKLPRCASLTVAGQLGYRACPDGTSYVEKGGRGGIRVTLKDPETRNEVVIDLRVFVVATNRESVDWGVEISLRTHLLGRGTRSARSPSSSFLIHLNYFTLPSSSFNYY